MKYVALFLRLAAWLNQFLGFVDRETAKQEERKRIAEANAARLERQNEVAKKPVSDDELRKSLRDGSF